MEVSLGKWNIIRDVRSFEESGEKIPKDGEEESSFCKLNSRYKTLEARRRMTHYGHERSILQNHGK